MNLSQITQKLTPRGWLMLGGSAAAAVVFLYLLFTMASAPSYTTLLAGVDPTQTGKITSALSTAGIPYQIQNNGTAVAVESDREAQARVALATAGLLSGGGGGTAASVGGGSGGFSLFNTQSLGASNFQQQVNYQVALEQQLDGTIESIQGVSSAQVQLVLPNPSSELFTNSTTPSTASVLLDDSGSIDPGSVKGIAALVANAVPGLSTSKVTITDQTGALLWPSTDGGADSGMLAKQAAEAAYDAQMEEQVNAMLTQTLGAGKAQVEVSADLNTNQTSSQTLTYAKKGTPLSTNTSVETLTGAGGSVGGVAGVAGTATTGSGNSKYSNKTSQTNWGVDKTITNSQIASGNVNRQSVSVLIDKSVPASELPSLKAAVAGAVGLNTTRGDTLSIAQIAFAKLPAAAASSGTSSMIGKAKYGVVGLGAVLFLFFISRMLKRRENEAFAGNPTWLRELEAPRSLASVEAQQLGEPTRIAQLRSPVNVAKQQVEDLVEREPDRVAAQVRAWMSED
jgi:flagellar M-ring protein FliF